MNYISILKTVIVIILNAMAYASGLFSYCCVLHPYAWPDYPEMANYVSPDCALVALVCSAFGLLLGVIASIISLLGLLKKRTVKDFILLIVSVGVVPICSYRLVEVIPLYPGGHSL